MCLLRNTEVEKQVAESCWVVVDDTVVMLCTSSAWHWMSAWYWKYGDTQLLSLEVGSPSSLCSQEVDKLLKLSSFELSVKSVM